MGAGAEAALRLAKRLRGTIGNVPDGKTNTLVFGHTANLREATDIWPKPEGVAVIFRPLGDGRYEYVTSIHPDSWSRAMSATKLPVPRFSLTAPSVQARTSVAATGIMPLMPSM